MPIPDPLGVVHMKKLEQVVGSRLTLERGRTGKSVRCLVLVDPLALTLQCGQRMCSKPSLGGWRKLRGLQAARW